MHHFGGSGQQGAVPVGEPPVDMLDPALWELAGYRTNRISLTRPGGTGPLIVTVTDAVNSAAQCGIRLIGSNAYTDALVEMELVAKTWPASDTIFAGPAVRLSGTNLTADWYAYFTAWRRFNSSSRRCSPRRFISGTSSAAGTETVGLPAGWGDSATHVTLQCQIVGNTLTTRGKLAADAGWAHDLTEDRTADGMLTSGGVGLFMHVGPVGMSMEIHNIVVTQL